MEKAKSLFKEKLGEGVILLSLISLAIWFIMGSFSFPKEEYGPAFIPRFWSVVLIVLVLGSFYHLMKAPIRKLTKPNFKILSLLILNCAVYLGLMTTFGYFPMSFLFLFLLLYLLGNKKLWLNLVLSTGWCIFSYFVFQKLLYIQLPLGSVFEGAF